MMIARFILRVLVRLWTAGTILFVVHAIRIWLAEREERKAFAQIREIEVAPQCPHCFRYWGYINCTGYTDMCEPGAGYFPRMT